MQWDSGFGRAVGRKGLVANSSSLLLAHASWIGGGAKRDPTGPER
jgi:hypothetical protein